MFGLKKFLVLPFIFVISVSAEISFNKDVRPIISQTCFACHGPDEKHLSGGLQLSNLAAAMRGGDSGDAAIVPGDAGKSKMVQRIFSNDPYLKMPPPEFHASLTAQQKQILADWIDQGAQYEMHWAFKPPEKSPLPDVGASGSENPIDRFVESHLAKMSKKINPREELATLTRRLFLDLTGLPPKLSDLDTIVSFDHVNPLVDKLLSSPHYGERMALDWMDVSRYADTHGYSRDGTRHMWLWRDWVINAFNENKPYDQFIKEQIAGDLIKDPSDGALIATGFNRLHPITQEGGTIPEENLTNYVIDRVKTTSEAILGLTMACAQCHDHKYDPISQKEYYQFFAFFNQLGDKGIDGSEGRNAAPVFSAYSPLKDPSILKALILQKKDLLLELHKKIPHEQFLWEKQILADLQQEKNCSSLLLKPVSATHPSSHEPVNFEDNHTCRLAVPQDALNISFEIPQDFGLISGIRFRAIPAAQDQKASFDGEKDFGLKSLSASFSEAIAPTVDLNDLENFIQVTASSTKNWMHPPMKAFQPLGSWLSSSDYGQSVEITGTLERLVDSKKVRYLTLELIFPQNNAPRLFQVEVFRGNDLRSPHPPAVINALRKNVENRSHEDLRVIKAYFEKTSEIKESARVAIENVNARIKYHSSKHELMVMNEAAKPRKTYVLNRGSYDEKLEEVQAGTPNIFPVLQGAGDSANRLDLANWFFESQQPTTARVAVNRIWALFFGRGLSESLSDFGSQGTYPTYPELLDWLAVEFQDSGWNIKKLVRLIVTSNVYQQSSDATSEQLLWDPKNVYLGRGPRFRLQAEFIRDLFLQASGLLNDELGGPSVNPYQPGDLWREISHFGSVADPGQTFLQSRGNNLYRRSLYTFWKRTLPPPNMTAFDAPNREVCSVGRSVTNTPLQALVLLNDTQFVESSRVLAARILGEDVPASQKLRRAFRSVTSKEPSDTQLEILLEQLDSEMRYFNENPKRAEALLDVGEYRSSIDKDKFVEHAAWTNVASLIFNLSQTITRN
jgi:hypothetical protein